MNFLMTSLGRGLKHKALALQAIQIMVSYGIWKKLCMSKEFLSVSFVIKDKATDTLIGCTLRPRYYANKMYRNVNSARSSSEDSNTHCP